MNERLAFVPPVALGLALVVAAVAHQSVVGTIAYTMSGLVDVEVLLILGVLFTLALQLPLFAVLAFQRKWRSLGIGVGCMVATVLLLGAAAVIDAPTLLWMT